MPEPLRAEQFRALLERLGPDPDLAGTRYEELRRRLVSLFEYRCCRHPEELADEALDRAARRLEELGGDFLGSDPARFVYGVAWNVARESFRRPIPVPLPERWEQLGSAPPALDEDGEREQACLDRCLNRMEPDERKLVLGYFEGEKGDRIARRSDIARGLGVSPNALRLKIHRLTGRLRECVVHCLQQGMVAGEAIAPAGAGRD